MTTLARWLEALYKACAAVACALLLLLFALVVFSIGTRLLGIYIGGATDIAGYVMAAATFLALAPTFRAGGHIYVSLLVNRLPPQARHIASLAAHGCMVGAAAGLSIYLWRLTYFSFLFDERSEGADAILLWIPQLPVSIGSTVFALAVLHSTVDTARKKP